MCAYLGERHPDCEIILVDDGSTDGTCAAIEAVAATLPTPIRLLRYETNRGKEHALKVGFARSRDRRVLFSDADLSTPIEELEKLLTVLDAGNPIAVGSRKMIGAEINVHQNLLREWLGKGFTLHVNMAITNVSDATCGFKLFDGDVGRELFSLTRIDDWTFDAEVLFLAARKGHAIVEIPVRWSDAEGTKVRLGRDVLNSAMGILRVGLGTEDRVLEVGAGFGRFSFSLLRHCRSMVALDLSPRVLEDLERERNHRGVPAERCQTLCGDVATMTDAELGRFDAVVGFFILHHLPAVPDAIANLSRLVRPGGVMAFLEPNRRNPLFLLQVACCQDMTWRDEKGMFKLSARSVLDDYRASGLDPEPVLRFGFFPPGLFNAYPSVRRLESALEGTRALEPVLPFLLLSARGKRATES